MDCIYMVLHYLTGQSALQCCLSFTHAHTHSDGNRAAMRGASLPVGSNSGFSVSSGHSDTWAGGAEDQMTIAALHFASHVMINARDELTHV